MFTINAQVRKDQGKGASRRLRHNDKLPAIVYGGKEAPISIELQHNDIINIESKPEFHEVMTLVIDGKETKVKAQAIQRHPFKPKVAHIDFLRA